MKYILIIITQFFFFGSFAQNFTKGLIMRDSEIYSGNGVYIPDSGLKAYNEFGEPIGSIVVKDLWKVFFKNEELKRIERSSLFAVGYEVSALKYTDALGGFVLVDEKYWIEIEELNAKGLKIVNWMQYAIDQGSGWYPNNPGLNLRKGASTKFDIITTLKGDLFNIKPLQETNGLWCKVEVTEYKAHPCSGGNDLVIRTIIGWVKLISDELTLNVYNYSRGC